MADSGIKVQVRGLAELRRAFNQIEGNEKGEFKAAFLPIANHVAGVVQQRMPHRSGRAQSSVMGAATDYGAKLKAGGSKAPYYHFLDFGGSVGRGHKPGIANSGAIKRPFIKGGRYLYPGAEEARDDIAEAAGDAIIRLARRAGFEARG